MRRRKKKEKRDKQEVRLRYRWIQTATRDVLDRPVSRLRRAKKVPRVHSHPKS